MTDRHRPEPSIASSYDLPRRDVYRTTRQLVNIAAGALVLVFGYLQLSGADYASIASSFSANAIFKVALALYYGSWVAGLLRDTSAHEATYSRPPTNDRMPIGGFVGALILATGFGILCVWAHNPTRFAAFLGVFLAVNFVGWRYLIRQLQPTAAESRRAFAMDYFRLERLTLVYDVYLCGRWQNHRFAIGATMIAILNILVHAGASKLVVALAILGYVVVLETWIWLVRFDIGASARLLDRLSTQYLLVRPSVD